MKETMALTRTGIEQALRTTAHMPLLARERDSRDVFVPRAELSTDALRLLSQRRVKGIDDDFADR